METHIRVSIKTIDSMDSVLTYGKMVKLHIREVSRMALDTAKENGLEDKQNTQEVMFKVSSRATVSCIFQVAIFTKEISYKIRDRATVKCFGLTDHFTKETGTQAIKTERVSCT